MSFRIYLFVFLLSVFLFQKSSFAIDFVIIENAFKQKVKLNINEKSVIKKVKVEMESLEAVGSKGNKGVKPNIGGYCFKFGKQKSFYKKFKFHEGITIFPKFENCYKNIESYNNFSDNILHEGYIFETFFLSEKVNYLDWKQFSLKGLSQKLKNSNNNIKNLMYVNAKNNYSQSILFIPTDLYEENNYSAKEVLKSLELLLKKYENSDLTESQLKKQSMNTILKLDTFVDYFSSIMMILEKAKSLKNRNYIHLCVEENFSMSGSFNQTEGGFIIDDNTIESLNIINDKFNKPLNEFEFDGALMHEDFIDTIKGVFDGCNYSHSMGKLLIQSRN